MFCIDESLHLDARVTTDVRGAPLADVGVVIDNGDTKRVTDGAMVEPIMVNAAATTPIPRSKSRFALLVLGGHTWEGDMYFGCTEDTDMVWLSEHIPIPLMRPLWV